MREAGGMRVLWAQLIILTRSSFSRAIRCLRHELGAVSLLSSGTCLRAGPRGDGTRPYGVILTPGPIPAVSDV